MRLPRLRFTLRRMMVAVAFVAALTFTLVTGARMLRKRAFCLNQAALAALIEANWKAGQDRVASLLASVEGQPPPHIPAEVRAKAICSLRAELSAMAPKAAYYAGLRRKWEQAAAYPWLPVAPDPPEPE